MEPAALVLLGPGGQADERVAGYVLPPLTWRPGAQCQFERDALERLFAGLEGLRRRGEAVALELADRTLRCRITAVDRAAQLLELEEMSG